MMRFFDAPDDDRDEFVEAPEILLEIDEPVEEPETPAEDTPDPSDNDRENAA